MELETLIFGFIASKKQKPETVNELLDFAQRCYINNELSISQYRSLLQQLTARGANKPACSSDGHRLFTLENSGS
ncbi:YppF family protein [Aneurinibacillus sp. Ricciae_BoGa-3]|uniref:YppF family protein n=1 Tax=Aneurinibacillus sp. Ricciae_BoGa-3 TaxID=3022697 RepID=UPI00233FAD88|nr:YppF family protein [Aneurinibacillus sp. Ricciae_BoGa-3]WCK53325.1 YppF family protein [Aneurinibacillus sp. Ricciae_BoGa-3]